ncbi:MAG: acyl-CoA thioesterase, partial [bacterium]|nr:acyl-CoA thioesterase [bacterium]
MIYEFKTSVKMYDTDAAGILFFGNQFRLVEDAYEAYLESKGFPLVNFLDKTSYIMPVVHAETSYRAPLRVSDKIVIKLTIAKIGTTSFT